MRPLALLVIGAALVSCTTTSEPVQRSPRDQQKLDALLAGKEQGAPMTCLQTYDANDMQIIDDRTVAYRTGRRTVYLMHLSPGCHMLGTGNYALLTRQTGGMGMCRGDIAQVVDTTNRITVGSCGIDAIVPYTAAER